MRSLMLCLVVLPFLISCTGSSETNKAGISSESQSTLQLRDLPKITNSIGMKLVLIPKGTFTMGPTIEEKVLFGHEEQHEVTISQDYYLGVTEVTQAQYEKMMGKNPSYFQGAKVGNANTDLPVENVSWDDAVEFCKKLSDLPEEKKAGRVYRLPTEAEWEYACRSGSKSAYSFGESSKSLGDYAWFDENSNGQTNPVGQKKPNAWGLYDMLGNVWEWCSDWYDEYPKGAVSDPTGPIKGSVRVYRGGSWRNVPAGCRSAGRRRSAPSLRGDDLGFRVALSPSGIPQSPEADK
jgi:formylglycine-generating enzyme required for sulfatase activity